MSDFHLYRVQLIEDPNGEGEPEGYDILEAGSEDVIATLENEEDADTLVDYLNGSVRGGFSYARAPGKRVFNILNTEDVRIATVEGEEHAQGIVSQLNRGA